MEGLSNVRMFHWDQEIKSNIFYLENIALLGLNQTHLVVVVLGGDWWLDKLGMKPNKP